MSDKIYKSIIDECHSFNINLNDVYWWGCADCETVEDGDMHKLVPLFDKFGTNFTLWAYTTVKRSFNKSDWLKQYPQNPMLKHVGKSKKDFDIVRDEVLKLLDGDDGILFDEQYNKEEIDKEVEEFGEPIVKKWHNKIEGLSHTWCFAQLEKLEITGIARNMKDAKSELKRKFEEIESNG